MIAYFGLDIHLGKPIERWGRKVSGLQGVRPRIAGLQELLSRAWLASIILRCTLFPAGVDPFKAYCPERMFRGKDYEQPRQYLECPHTI